jgi:phage terminase large subunit-like protein
MKSKTLSHRVDLYAERVHEHDLVAGPLVRLACDRHLKEHRQALTKAGHPRGFWFDAAAADHIIAFYETVLKLSDTLNEDGDPIPFLLTPANTFIVGSLFGWKIPERAGGWRRYREAYIEMGKGNAKTPLFSGIGLYGLVMDGEQAAEIYSAATGFAQAAILWLDAQRMVDASPELKAIIYQSQHNLAYEPTMSFFRPVSREKRGKSGPRPHMVLMDEMHEYADAVLVNIYRAGTKRRKQPLIGAITNSGYDRTSICFQHHEHARKVNEGLVEDDRFFGYVCGLDKDDDFLNDPTCWPKANPNLGIVIQSAYLERQVQNAKNIPAELNTVLRLNGCVWTSQHVEAWDMTKWRNECAALTFTDDDLIGRPCYGALDLGQTDDFTAWVRIWELVNGLIAMKARFWLPQSALLKYPDRPYAEWKRAGLLEVTEGTTTDEDLVEAAVLEDARDSGVLEIAYDKRFANHMALHFQGAGLTVVDTPQGFALNESIQSVAKLIADGTLAHGNNLIMTWMMDNTVLRHGRNKEVRLDKDAAKEKIDGPSALVMANARRIAQVPKEDDLTELLVI